MEIYQIKEKVTRHEEIAQKGLNIICKSLDVKPNIPRAFTQQLKLHWTTN